MVISNKQKKIVIISAIIVTLVIICAVFYAAREKYSENWIIGKSRDEIEERYGEFDLNFNSIAAYKLPEDPLDSIWSYYMGGDPVNYYYIKFNEKGAAEETYTGPYPGG